MRGGWRARRRPRSTATAAFVLAGDTVVAVGRRILPKAEDEATARAVPRAALRPAPPRVLGGRLARAGRHAARAAERDDRALQARSRGEEIAAYLAGGEWHGKAGGYAIQGSAEGLIAWIAGSHSGVVGLPLFETRALLKAAGFPLAEWLDRGGASARTARCWSRAVAIVAARLALAGRAAAGQVEDAVLVAFAPVAAAARRASPDGEEALVDRLPPAVSEGAAIAVGGDPRGDRRARAAQARPSAAERGGSRGPPRRSPQALARKRRIAVARGAPIPAGAWRQSCWSEACARRNRLRRRRAAVQPSPRR